jgi:hypothetical protein
MKPILARARSWCAWLYLLPARHPLAAPIALALFFSAATALARPGGGQSYSGGGSSRSGGSSSGSSSGSGGGGGSSGNFLVDLLIDILFEILAYLLWELVKLLFELTIKYPTIMLPLYAGIILITVIVVYRARWLKALGWSSSHGFGYLDRLDGWRWMQSWDRDGALALSIPTERVVERGPSGAECTLRQELSGDEQFSSLLFADFAQGLYAALHGARGQRRLDHLAPYLSPSARGTLEALSPGVTEVRGVVVGMLAFEPSCRSTPGVVYAQLRIKANYTEVREGGPPVSYFTEESWLFSRKEGVQTRKREGAHTFGCPGCGGPLDRAYQGRCARCGQAVENGDFDWVVSQITVHEREVRRHLLGATVEEVGTTDRTVVDPSVDREWSALRQRDPAVTEAALAGRIAAVFDALQVAWSTQQWSKARAFVSDATFESMRYWLEMYKAAGQRNVTDGAKLRRLELVRVWRDGHLDALTVRVFASSLDYTIKEPGGQLVTGSKSERRRYTEYWTFIRSRSAHGAPRAEPICPRCGAELNVSMAGDCTYCRAHVVTGEFDWVLSRIEQDEEYRG